jgi:hypothetical protein
MGDTPYNVPARQRRRSVLGRARHFLARDPLQGHGQDRHRLEGPPHPLAGRLRAQYGDVVLSAGRLTGVGVVLAVSLGVVAVASGAAVPATGGDQLVERLGIPHDDGVLEWTAVPVGSRVLFGFVVYPTAPGLGGFQPGCKAKPSRGYLAVRHSSGRLAALGRIDPLAAAPVAGAGRIATLVYKRNCKGSPVNDGGSLPLERLRLERGTIRHAGAHSRMLASNAEPYGATVVADGRGDIAAAWLQPDARRDFERSDRLMISVGTMAGTMSKPQMLAPTVTDVRLAWASDGELLAAYSTGAHVEVRSRPRGGSFSPPLVLAPTRCCSLDLDIAVGPRGRAAVVWGAQASGIEVDSPWQVRSSVRTAAHRAFPRAILLDPGHSPRRQGTPVSVRIGTDDLITIAWTSDRGHRAVLVAIADARGHVITRQTLATGGRNLYVTAAPGGGTLLHWRTLSGQARQAVRRPHATRFGRSSIASSLAGQAEGILLTDSRTGE